jgi:hypothetical protein
MSNALDNLGLHARSAKQAEVLPLMGPRRDAANGSGQQEARPRC